MASIGSRELADIICETLRECRRGYPDAPFVMEGFAMSYAAKTRVLNPMFQHKAFLRRALNQSEEASE